MNLPNYFLADLPAHNELNPTIISEACQTLKRNREKYLLTRSTQSLIHTLSKLAADWLQSDNPFRKLALELGPGATGFSAATIANGLDSFFKQLNPENFHALLEQDLGHAMRLEEMVASAPEEKTDRASIVTAPELLAHITAGDIPNPTLHSIVLGLLARCAQFIKCASGSSLLPRLFAHSLYEIEPKLASCLEIAEWPGGTSALEDALFAQADCVTATGSDETLAAIRQKLPTRTRFLGYGHRVSFAFVANGVLSGLNTRKVIERAAADSTAWNQWGCLSPHVIYVQSGGKISPQQFAAMLGEELARREQAEPRGELSIEEAALISSRRSFYEVRAAYSEETRLWRSEDSTAWTIVFESDPQFQLSCLNRFIYIKQVADLDEALAGADPVREKVSTVGLAATEDKAQALATQLARWGATRICPLGQMQEPPLLWRHDGRLALADLVRWTDWEME